MIRLGIRAGLRVSGISRDPANAWTGLISERASRSGSARSLRPSFPEWGNVQTLLVALIAIHELVGPIVFRQGLARAGEARCDGAEALMVVSNREPYLHNHNGDGHIVASPATGGVAVALDALMRERGGVWIAHGAGSADRAVVDASDRVPVPPENPSYQLRRLWIDEPAFSAYYGGFSNEGLWPLCHMVDVRPQFRSEDWAAYQDVNVRFAAAIDQELAAPTANLHPRLPSRARRTGAAARRPDARTALFWHIPWPYPDRLRICPWRQEILTGLLANDLLAFQLERDRRNFLLAVEDELGAEIETEASEVRLNGRHTTVVSMPDRRRLRPHPANRSGSGAQGGTGTVGPVVLLRAPIIGIGVDRLDYTRVSLSGLPHSTRYSRSVPSCADG